MQPDTPEPDTRTRLLRAAAELFRNKGYHAVGLAELLQAARAPKGSLYHHFPRGKADLALAAADHAGQDLTRAIAKAYGAAQSLEEGRATLFRRVGRAVDATGGLLGCPVGNTLPIGPETPEFQAALAAIFTGWITQVADAARRMGHPEAEARRAGERLFVELQGAFTLARAQGSGAVFLRLLEEP